MDSLPYALVQYIAKLRPSQLKRVERFISALVDGTTFVTNPRSDFANEAFAEEFGDQLRQHHSGTAQPMTKLPFEYALADALNSTGHSAHLYGSGNPGADLEVDGAPWSLKSQADRAIKSDKITISKYMELGGGDWVTVQDIEQLREKMFGHMTKYDRIFTLRCLSRKANIEGSPIFDYELVEIPKPLLARAANFPIVLAQGSRQTPVPARCTVLDDDGAKAFDLYFDGGGERKLQIQHLAKRNCIVHARWSLTTS